MAPVECNLLVQSILTKRLPSLEGGSLLLNGLVIKDIYSTR